MINNDRIVPVQAIDLITLYGLILKRSSGAGATLASVGVSGGAGEFEFATVTDGSSYLLDEPVKSLELAAATESAEFVVYFVPAYDFAGVTLGGVAAVYEEGSVDIEADGVTLYALNCQQGDFIVTKVGL